MNFCKDWAKHKLDCKEIRRRKEAEEAKAKQKIEPKKSKPDDEDDSDSDTESSTRRGQKFVNLVMPDDQALLKNVTFYFTHVRSFLSKIILCKIKKRLT